MLSFKDKCVLVTGSTSGIGKAMAQQFVTAGASVVINGRSQERIDPIVEELQQIANGSGQQICGVEADVSTAQGVQTLISKLDNKHIIVDVLVHNVGIFYAKDFFDVSDDEWQQYMDVNFFSTVRICRHFLKQMLERNAGNILITASEAGIRIIPEMMPYSVTKSAQIALAKGLAQQAKGTNVRVNSLIVGPTWTEGVQKYIKGLAEQKGNSVDKQVAEYFKEFEPTSTIQRFLEPMEVANQALFLASDLASGITGSAARVEGGIIRHL